MPYCHHFPVTAALRRALRLLPLVLPLIAAQARAVSTTIVISQVYGGGGSSLSTASYRNDYVELFNIGSATVNVSGWSVQYASATGSTWQTTALSGTIEPGRYYLVQENGGTTNGAVLPTPDAIGIISMGGTNGKIALVSGATALTGAAPAGPGIVDLVGYGAAGFYETAPAGALSITTAALRKSEGCQDTDNNGADLTVGAPTPRNSSNAAHPCNLPAQPVLAFTTQPAGAVAGAAFATQPVVTARESGGGTVTAFSGAVTLAVRAGTGAPSGTLAGTTTVTAVDGVAAFTDLAINAAGTGYVLTASATGADPGESTAFDVAPGAPAQFAFTVQPSNSPLGQSISPPPAVTAQDAWGNPTPAFAGPVSVVLGGGTAGAALSGVATVDAVDGVATWPGLSVDRPGADYTLTASSGSLLPANSAAFNITGGAPASLVFVTQPGGAAAGAPLSPQPAVAVLDADGLLATFSGAVTLSLKAGAGTAGAVLAGSATMPVVDGLAAFTDLSVDLPGTGYVLVASADALSAESAPFTVTAPPAPTGYSITDLGVLPSAEAGSTAYSVNNRGQVAGWSGHPFLWSGGSMTDLNAALTGSIFGESPARDVNDAGVVVGGFYAWVNVAHVTAGDFNAFSAPHAFRWADGVFTDLSPAATAPQRAVAVNNAGDIAVAADTSYVRKADGSTVNLNGIVSGTYLTPNDINDAGDVAGDAVTADLTTHGVLWHAGAATDIGTLPGDVNSSARAINAAGVLIGDSYGAISSNTNTHAIRRRNGAISALPARSASESCVAQGINNYDQTVGYAGRDVADGSEVGALLWDANGVHDLQTLIPPGGWQLSAARSVNDLGQIAGYGWHNNVPRAFLLTPNVVFGDADGDGVLTMADGILVMAIAGGLAPAPDIIYLDVAPSPSAAPRGFGDFRLDSLDAVRILRKVASLETRWP